jgi:hypothetical protein
MTGSGLCDDNVDDDDYDNINFNFFSNTLKTIYCLVEILYQ